MKIRTLLLIAGSSLTLVRCMPATARAVTAANVPDAITCTASALGSMGYEVLAADEKNRLVQGQRLKHATNPFSGAMDADRITVILDRDEAQTTLRVIGETVGTLTGVRFPSVTRRGRAGIPGEYDSGNRLVRKWTSREVAADTEEIAHACSD